MVKGDVTVELAFCDVAELTDEEKRAELDAGDPLVDGKPPGGPLTPLGSTRAPPDLAAADVGFMPFKSPIEAGQAPPASAPKREKSSAAKQPGSIGMRPGRSTAASGRGG